MISFIMFLNLISWGVSVGWVVTDGMLYPFVYWISMRWMFNANIGLVVGERKVLIPSMSGLRIVVASAIWHWNT